MDKYPTDVLKENLESIYIVQKLNFCGVSAAGTNSRNKIYLANNGLSGGYTNDFIE